MLEPIINQTYTIDGKTVKCVEQPNSTCEKCFIGFLNEHKCIEYQCCKEDRKDGKDIILEIV